MARKKRNPEELLKFPTANLPADVQKQISKREAKGLKVTPSWIEEKIAMIGDDAEHKDQLRALQLLAQMRGMLTEKIQLTGDRKEVDKQIADAIALLIDKKSELTTEAPKSEVLN